MRIQCPNCDAQYEVPDEVIPFEGRDVQCSNCGRTWFHPHPDNPEAADDVDDAEGDGDTADLSADEPLDEGVAPTQPDGDWAEDEDADPASDPHSDADTAARSDAEDTGDQSGVADDAFSHEDDGEAATYEDTYEEDAYEDDGLDDAYSDPPDADLSRDFDDSDDEADGHLSPPPDLPQRKPLDNEVEAILREEAEIEQAARDAETLEVQQDLGLSDTEDQTERRARESRERMARLKGEASSIEDAQPQTISSEAEAAAAAAALGSRRELLPDIEEINSTLRSTSDRAVAGNDPSAEASIRGHKRRGFRRGFVTTLLIFAMALLVYIFARDIAQAVPQADPYLSAYVNWVDALRLWLDGQMRAVLDWLNAQAGQS